MTRTPYNKSYRLDGVAAPLQPPLRLPDKRRSASRRKRPQEVHARSIRPVCFLGRTGQCLADSEPAHLRGEPMYVAAAAGHLHRHGDCSKETHACVCSPRGGHLQLSQMGNLGASDECHHAPRLQWQCASEILPVSRPY